MRIAGIDIGATHIKLVEVNSALGSYEIHDHYEAKITDSSPEGIRQALDGLISGLVRKPDRVVMALSSGKITFRNIELPTKDKRAIQAGIGFELEDELPSPIEDISYDYSIIKQLGKSSHLHVAAVLRSALTETVAAYEGSLADPDVITTEAWAFRTFFNRTQVSAPDSPSEPVMLASIGHTKTTLYVHYQGYPVLCREIPWGGVHLTQAICVRYQIPMEQAEQAKLDHGFVIAGIPIQNLTPEQIEFSNTLLQPLQILVSEMRQAVLSAKAITKQNVVRVHLSGGTALLPGLAPAIEEGLRLPTSMLRGVSALSSSGVTYSEQTDTRFLLATCLALGLVGKDKSNGINFRKGNFAKVGKAREVNWKVFRKPMLAAAIILCTLYTSVFVQMSVYRSKLTDTNRQLEDATKRLFPALSAGQVRAKLKSVSTLRNDLDKELKRTRELARIFSPSTRSPVQFLKHVSTAVPKDVVVDLIDFQVGAASTNSFLNLEPANTSMTFIYTNPQVGDRLSSLLASKISGLKKTTPEEITLPDGSGKKWKLTVSGTPTEDAYGR